MRIIGDHVSRHGLENHGLKNLKSVSWNLGPAALYEDAIRRGEGVITADGAMLVTTGVHTGRSPKDKFIVESDTTRDTVDWGTVNQKISRERFDACSACVGLPAA